MTTRQLSPGALSLSDLRCIANGGVKLTLDPACHAAIDAGARAVRDVVDKGDTIYGVNTGFGLLARTRIDDAQLQTLQRRLVLSHATGLGAPLADDVIRLVLALKAGSLALGHSGVRREVVEALVALFNAGAYPVVPEKGSVGASGDLAPLAHLSAVLIGEGEVRLNGKVVPAAKGLTKAGLKPLALEAKEGLALLNGTQVSTALALAGLFAVENVFAAAVVAGAMSVDGALGSTTPFDPRIHALRGHAGQRDVADVYVRLLDGSQIRDSHIDCDRVQDPYSLRCQPQVMGACLDQMSHAATVLGTEANAVSDNPLVFADRGEVLSGGNFHGQPVAFAADNLALAIAEIGALAERRIALLVDPNMNSGLPAFLIPDSGLNSGFMLAQVSAAALVSENKALAHPASVDSLPTSANQEDHVSMSTYAARRLDTMCENAAGVIAIELLAAAQAVELRRPLATSPDLSAVHGQLRRISPFLAEDRSLAAEIGAVAAWIRQGGFRGSVGEGLFRP